MDSTGFGPAKESMTLQPLCSGHFTNGRGLGSCMCVFACVRLIGPKPEAWTFVGFVHPWSPGLLESVKGTQEDTELIIVIFPTFYPSWIQCWKCGYFNFFLSFFFWHHCSMRENNDNTWKINQFFLVLLGSDKNSSYMGSIILTFSLTLIVILFFYKNNHQRCLYSQRQCA